MSELLDSAPALTEIETVVQFSVDTGETPISIVNEPGGGSDRRSGHYQDHRITIRDARPIAHRLDLDKQGFLLAEHPTHVSNFFDENLVSEVYYPEMADLVVKYTGADKVIVFDHTIRIDDPNEADARKVRNPVRNMHNDFTINSVAQRVRDLLPKEEAEERLKKRYGSINIWRPIVGPVETAPLTICGWDSLEQQNLIPAERRYQDRIGGVLHLSYNPNQEWFYFPKMTTDEVVILKCFDSLNDGTAKWTAHGSFQPPVTPKNARPRQSIEIRTLYFFDT
jgi:hypothetical protein